MKGEFEYEYDKKLYFKCEWVLTTNVGYYIDSLLNAEYITKVQFKIIYIPEKRKKIKVVKSENKNELNEFLNLRMDFNNLFFLLLANSISDSIFQKIQIIKNDY